jgi:hypothetical protein
LVQYCVNSKQCLNLDVANNSTLWILYHSTNQRSIYCLYCVCVLHIVYIVGHDLWSYANEVDNLIKSQIKIVKKSSIMPPFLKVGQLEIGDPDCHTMSNINQFSPLTHSSVNFNGSASSNYLAHKKKCTHKQAAGEGRALGLYVKCNRRNANERFHSQINWRCN